MNSPKILLGSDIFKTRLGQVAAAANESLVVQAMTFEGDSAGKWLIDTMLASHAKEKKLLIDSFSKVVISDSFIFSLRYLKDSNFRKEIKETSKLIEKAMKNGIQVKYTNPVGIFMRKYPLRNHKKMVIVDREISFLGGLNFSDHNFEWHDMMVELHDQTLGSYLKADFNKTWNGINQSTTFKIACGQLYLFNGSKSKTLYNEFFEHIKTAKKSIQIISPYISEPLLGVLKSMIDFNIKITIISPQVNNKSIFKNLILSEQKKKYFQLKEYPGMSHMKAILIDDEKLIFGSSNYDVISYYFEQEVVFISKDTHLIQEFKQKVLDKIQKNCSESTSIFATKKAAFLMKILFTAGKFMSKTILRPH